MAKKFTLAVVVREIRETRVLIDVESDYPQIHDVAHTLKVQSVEAVMAGREVEWSPSRCEIEGVYLVAEDGVRL